MNKKFTGTLKRIVCTMICANMVLLSGCGEVQNPSQSATTPEEGKTQAVITEPDIKPVGDVVTPEGVEIDETILISPLNASHVESFDGWGTSLCWWANRVGYSDSLSQKAAELFFGSDGLGMNIMRYNIGGGDDPLHNHITRTDSDVPGWLVYEDGEYHYDYDADKNQLNVLQRCVSEAGDEAIVEVFSNSPPYFMTVSGCSSGGFDSNIDNLKAESVEEFADYLATVTQYIVEDLGITVTSVSPMNEPNTNYWGAFNYKQEGCHFDAGESQSRIIVATAKKLHEKGLDNVIVAASDETSTAKQIDEYRAYSDEALKVIGRINTHTYDSSRIGELGTLSKEEGFKLWMSEVDGNGTSGTNAGEMGAALWFSEKIISDLNGLNPSAWIMWQAIDKHICEEGYKGRQDSGMIDLGTGFWGLAVADHDNDDIILSQKYYAMGQFTRFIRPGSRLISCGGRSLAAYDAEKGTLTVVALNTSDKNKTVNVDLSQFEKIGTGVQMIRTSGSMADGEHWKELDPFYAYDSGFVSTLKANSVTTFVIGGVVPGNTELNEINLKNAEVSGSSPWNNGSDTADNVIDGDLNSFFDGVADGWLIIDIGKKTDFSILGFSPRSGFERRMIGGSFYGSNDGEKWEEIYTVTTTPAFGMNYVKLKGSWRYLKYSVPSGRAEGASEDYLCNIAEIALFK